MGTPSMLVGARTAYLRTPQFNRIFGRLTGKAITSINGLDKDARKTAAHLSAQAFGSKKIWYVPLFHNATRRLEKDCEK